MILADAVPVFARLSVWLSVAELVMETAPCTAVEARGTQVYCLPVGSAVAKSAVLPLQNSKE
jgi:hypothetical protein